METTPSHVQMPLILVVANSLILIEVLVCGGEHNLVRNTGLIESGLETEETAAEEDWLEQKYSLEVKVAVRLKLVLRMDNGIPLSAKMT
jgi:hypothetical protein